MTIAQGQLVRTESPSAGSSDERMRSAICTQDALNDPAFRAVADILDPSGYIKTHRKLWEWCFISEALRREGALAPGKSGLGFAVGSEPLVSYFASFGAQILATDLDESEAAEKGWIETNQHSKDVSQLINHHTSTERFTKAVTYRPLDMNHIPSELSGQFDFCWSACSFEHLGSIEAGIQFVLNSLDCLKPDGIAVHTSEFNVSSNDDTVEDGPTVLFRRRDIEEIQRRAAERGWVMDMDYDCGTQPLDYHVDFPPFSHENHLKLRLMGYTCTSMGLIFTPADKPWRGNVTQTIRPFAQ